MRTPAGKECKYFHGDYYRGRNKEECRLLMTSGEKWTPSLCQTCPVPAILQANACEFLKLHGSVSRSISSFFQRRVEITAFCEKVDRSVAEPQIGCGECHPLPRLFELKAEKK